RRSSDLRLHLVQVIDHVRHVRVHTRHVRGVNNVSQLAHKRRVIRPDVRIDSSIAVVDVGLVVLVETVFQTRLVVEPGLVGKITVEYEVTNPVDNVVVGQRRGRQSEFGQVRDFLDLQIGRASGRGWEYT